jgi:outer membrane lipoprotein-sorting protein
MKISLVALLLLVFLPASVLSQEMVSADSFFSAVSDRYSGIQDYSAKVIITAGKASPMQGDLIYKSPSLLRIDFSVPADQVICFDGKTLTVYLPEYRAVLSQEVSDGAAGAKTGGAALASKQGLALMRRNYSIGYLSTPDPVPLDEGSEERVVKLILNRKTQTEGFSEIRLSVSPDTSLIRRIEGVAASKETFVFDFKSVKLNQNISDAKFIYDSPASANLYNNFLFKPEE